MTGCDFPNTYWVYELGKDENDKMCGKGMQLLRVDEFSFCTICMKGYDRPLDLMFSHVSPDNPEKDCQEVFKAIKKCTCTILCFCRTSLMVTHVEEEGHT